MSEQENIRKLKAEFPLVFAEEILCYSGFKDGWYPLVRQLCADIEKILADLQPEERAKFRVFQIKEKWGGLCFSTGMTDYTADYGLIIRLAEEPPLIYGQISDLVSEAEKRSIKICEFCGAAGAKREGRPVKTLCDSHANGAAHLAEGMMGWFDYEQD